MTLALEQRAPVALAQELPAAVLFDRDGTLIADVAYNSDPAQVFPLPGALSALTLLRSRGIRTGVVTNQSAVGRGMVTREQVEAVNARVEELLGPFDVWQVCYHAPDDGCGCRKPAPGMIVAAAEWIDVPASRCVMVGDIEADVLAARAAGARGILIPTSVTQPAEVTRSPEVAEDLLSAVHQLLGEDLPSRPSNAVSNPHEQDTL